MIRLYGVIIPVIFNLAGMIGFAVTNCILGGQALSSVANNNLSWTFVSLYFHLHGRSSSFKFPQKALASSLWHWSLSSFPSVDIEFSTGG